MFMKTALGKKQIDAIINKVFRRLIVEWTDDYIPDEQVIRDTVIKSNIAILGNAPAQGSRSGVKYHVPGQPKTTLDAAVTLVVDLLKNDFAPGNNDAGHNDKDENDEDAKGDDMEDFQDDNDAVCGHNDKDENNEDAKGNDMEDFQDDNNDSNTQVAAAYIHAGTQSHVEVPVDVGTQVAAAYVHAGTQSHVEVPVDVGTQVAAAYVHAGTQSQWIVEVPVDVGTQVAAAYVHAGTQSHVEVPVDVGTQVAAAYVHAGTQSHVEVPVDVGTQVAAAYVHAGTQSQGRIVEVPVDVGTQVAAAYVHAGTQSQGIVEVPVDVGTQVAAAYVHAGTQSQGIVEVPVDVGTQVAVDSCSRLKGDCEVTVRLECKCCSKLKAELSLVQEDNLRLLSTVDKLTSTNNSMIRDRQIASLRLTSLLQKHNCHVTSSSQSNNYNDGYSYRKRCLEQETHIFDHSHKRPCDDRRDCERSAKDRGWQERAERAAKNRGWQERAERAAKNRGWEERAERAVKDRGWEERAERAVMDHKRADYFIDSGDGGNTRDQPSREISVAPMDDEEVIAACGSRLTKLAA